MECRCQHIRLHGCHGTMLIWYPRSSSFWPLSRQLSAVNTIEPSSILTPSYNRYTDIIARCSASRDTRWRWFYPWLLPCISWQISPTQPYTTCSSTLWLTFLAPNLQAQPISIKHTTASLVVAATTRKSRSCMKYTV